MINKDSAKKKKVFFFPIIVIFFLLLVSSIVQASVYLDLAKDGVENYYMFSEEKDVDSYIGLFDTVFLREIYGTNYKEFFEELFSYVDILDYTITFQTYTEGEDSISVFYHVKANALLDGENHVIDQDLVAIFSKENNAVKLRYVMLQSVFSEIMVRESTFTSLMRASFEDSIDLVEEAIDAGIITVDNIEESLQERKSFFRFWRFLFFLLIGILMYIVYHKRNLCNNKIILHAKQKCLIFTKKIRPIFKKYASLSKKWYINKVVPKVKKVISIIKKWITTVFIPKVKIFVSNIKDVYQKKKK